MAEQIDIASLNFDTDKLTQSLVNTRTNIDRLKSQLTELRKEVRDDQKEINKLTEAQDELTKAGKESSDEYKTNQKELERLSKEQEKNTKATIEKEAALRTLSKEQRELNKIIDLQAKSQTDSTAIIEKANVVLEQQWKTQNEANQAGKAMMALRKELNPEIEEEAQLMEQLSKRIDEANEFQNLYNTQNEQRVKGIGRYKEAITDAIKETLSFGNATGQAGKGASGFASGIASGIPGLKGLTGAAQGFTAVPIVFVITSLIQGFKFLTEQFKGTQQGMDAINSVLRPLSAAFEAFKGIVQDVGKMIFDAFKNPKEAITDLYNFVKDKVITVFEAYGKVLKGIVTLDWGLIEEGVSDITDMAIEMYDKIADGAKNFSDRISDAYQTGQEIDRLTKEIETRESEMAKVRAENTRQMKEQELIARDQTKSVEERAKAIKEQTRLTEEMIDYEQKTLDLMIQKEKLQQSLNDSSRQDNKRLNELEAQRMDIENRRSSVARSNMRVERQLRNEVAREAQAREKERIQAILERRKISLETYVLENQNMAKNADEEIEFAREVSKRKLEILDQELENKSISQERYDLERKKSEMNLAQEEAEIRLFYATSYLNDEILSLQKQQEERKRLTIDSFLDETLEINRIADQQESLAKERLDAGLINRHEYNAQLLELEQQKNEQIKELNTEWEEQNRLDAELTRQLENEAILLDLQDQFDIRREIERQYFEDSLIDLEEQRAQGLINEENYEQALTNIHAKYAKVKKEIDKDVAENQVDIAKATLENMAAIFGEQSDVGKAFAIAQTTIDTYQAAVSAYQAMAAIPIVGPALGAVAAGAAIAMGMKNVQKIRSTRAEKYVGGYTGDGGVFTKTGNVHAGEVVFSQADVRAMGGVQNVERIRPTSGMYGDMPTGGNAQTQQETNWQMVANILAEGVERGSERGTNTGMVEAGENEYVRQKAVF